jgi:hypothetical protein
VAGALRPTGPGSRPDPRNGPTRRPVASSRTFPTGPAHHSKTRSSSNRTRSRWPPGASGGDRARASCIIPRVDTTGGRPPCIGPHRRNRRRSAQEVDVGTRTIPPFSGVRRGQRLPLAKHLPWVRVPLMRGTQAASGRGSERSASPRAIQLTPRNNRLIPTNRPITHSADAGHSCQIITPRITSMIPPANDQPHAAN